MHQATLFISKNEQAFNDFDEGNPQVYEALVKMSYDLKRQGHKRIGMKMLFEVLRWRSMMRTTAEDYKLNNNYTSYYVRKIIAEHPDMEGFFEMREQRGE